MDKFLKILKPILMIGAIGAASYFGGPGAANLAKEVMDAMLNSLPAQTEELPADSSH